MLAFFDYKESEYLSYERQDDLWTACENVSLSISGTFKAGVNGYWDTDVQFQPNSSIYGVTFKETPASYPEYTATIEKFEKKIKALGEKARLKDMFYTALAWATFSHYDYDTDMGIKLIADVDSLFGNWYGQSGSFNAYQRSEELASGATQPIMECYTRDPKNNVQPNVDDKLNYVSVESSLDNLIKVQMEAAVCG